MAQKLKTRTISGENEFTDPIEAVGYFNISISGTWDATISVQRSFDGGSTWFDVASWTSNTQEFGFEPERGVQYRIGSKLGNYTGGNPVLRISQ